MGKVELKQKKTLFFLKLIIPIVFFYFIFKQIDISIFQQVVRNANIKLLFICFIVEFLSIFLQGWRWKKILELNGSCHSFWYIQCVNFKAMFFDTFLPGKMGSDFYRWSNLRHKKNSSYLAGALILLRLQGAGVAFIVFLFFFSFSIFFENFFFLMTPIILVLLMMLFCTRILLKKISLGIASKINNNNIRSIIQVFSMHTENSYNFYYSAVLSFIFVLIASIIFILAGETFHMDVPYLKYLYGVPALMLVSSIPVSIHGRGITEFTAIYLWQGSSASTEQILLACLSIYTISLFQSLIAGVVIVYDKLIFFLKTNNLNSC